MKRFDARILAAMALLALASTAQAATYTMTTALPLPNIYYTGLANTAQPNYLITNLTFRAAIINYAPGGDITSDLLPYFYISAQDTFTYDAKSCIRYGPCSYFQGTSGDATSALNYPNVFQSGDVFDAKYQFSLYQAQNLNLGVTNWTGAGAYTLQLRDGANQLVVPDGAGVYALGGGTYTLEFQATFDSLASDATIVGVAAAVPEPAGAWLYGSGLLCLAAVARRQRSRRGRAAGHSAANAVAL